MIVNTAINQVEDVAGDDGSEGHAAPVLRQAVDAEHFGHESGVDAEKKSVCYCRGV